MDHSLQSIHGHSLQSIHGAQSTEHPWSTVYRASMDLSLQSIHIPQSTEHPWTTGHDPWGVNPGLEAIAGVEGAEDCFEGDSKISLVVQCLRFHAPKCRWPGFNPWSRN